MADYTSRLVHTTHKIWTLETPTNWAEISKVIVAITHDEDYKRYRTGADNEIEVTTTDETITFSMVIPEGASTHNGTFRYVGEPIVEEEEPDVCKSEAQGRDSCPVRWPYKRSSWCTHCQQAFS